MKQTLLIIIILLFGCGKKNSIDFSNAKWTNKDQLTYNVELTEIDIVKDSITGVIKSFYRARLEIISLDSVNTIKWHILSPKKKPDSLITQMSRLRSDTVDYIEILQIIYQTNHIGQYEKIINWPIVEKYVDSLWKVEFKENVNDSSKQEVFAKFKSTFTNRPAIEANIMRDVLALHLIYNSEILNDENESRNIVAGIMNSPISSSKTTKILENYDDHAIIRVTSKLDPKEVKNQISTLLAPLINSTTNDEINIHDTAIIDFNKNSGWAKHIEYWRIGTIENRKKQICVSLKQIEN